MTDVLSARRGYWEDQGYRGTEDCDARRASSIRLSSGSVIGWRRWRSPCSIASGLEIFAAFPSFGDKIPQRDLFALPGAVRLGGWLGGALQWHLTFAWLFAASGVAYVLYQLASGNYRQVLFGAADVPGVWPMVRHYFLFGPEAAADGRPTTRCRSSPTRAPSAWASSLVVTGLGAVQAGATVVARHGARRLPS